MKLQLRILSFVVLQYIIVFVYACDPLDVSLTNVSTKIINVEPSNTAIRHLVGGSVKIVDGCTFTVRNMTIIPTGNSAYWYGVPKKNNTDLYPRVVPAALGSYNGQFITFKLDPQYSFTDMSIMEIRSEGDFRAYGAFAITGNVDEYYGLRKGNTLDIDPTQPFKDSGFVRVNNSMYSLFFMILLMIILL